MPHRHVILPLLVFWFAGFVDCSGNPGGLATQNALVEAEFRAAQDTAAVQGTSTAAVRTATADAQATAFQAQTATAAAQTATADADRVRTFATIEAEFTATAKAAAEAALTATTLANLSRPPVITKFPAKFVPDDRTTYYDVVVVDPDALPTDKLRYEWAITNVCGAFSWDDEDFDDPSAEWYHPHLPCPDERFHPATITVTVTNRQGNQAIYGCTGGSASGEVVVAPPP